MAVILTASALVAAADEVPRISIEKTKDILDKPDVVIVDVRTAKSWWKSSTKILHAIREEPKLIMQWQKKYPKNKTLIFY